MTARKELWQYPFYRFQKEVIRSKDRRKTKGQLGQIFRKGGYSVSPKIQTEVREGADDVREGVVYQITNCEDVSTDVQKLEGIRVSLVSARGEDGNVVLWKRPVTGKTSKLGVFITVLGDNTDKWLRKWILFKVWQPRNRVIEVVSAPVPKAPKAAKPKAN